jgi:DNA modification methylase
MEGTMTVSTQFIPNHSLQLDTIHQGDCLELMHRIEASSIDLVFADPPFNIGYEYDQYHDRQERDEYIMWSSKWMDEVFRVLKPNGTFWLAIGDEYAAELKVAAHEIGFSTRSWVVWYYTFGVNCTKKFSRSHVHLFHFVKDENSFTFNAEDPSVRVKSARALVYADKRANPNGRLPDDTWILRPQDLPQGFDTMDDTVYFARVAGTFAERQGFHGCQMPEQLLGRIIRVSSNPGDIVLDPFAGSGTTLAVGKKLRRRWIGCELSKEYVREALTRLSRVQIGDPLDGPEDPIASAPSTSNGRKLESVQLSSPSVKAREFEPSKLKADIATNNAEWDTPLSSSDKSDFSVLNAINEALVEAFLLAHDGYSTDWMLASPELQGAFHKQCERLGLIGGPADWNHRLLRLRKSGRLPKISSLKHVHFSSGEMDCYQFASEMSWRVTSDKFGGASLDEIFCDPTKALYFDRIARRFAPGYEATKYRWAALRLRKASKTLVSEATQFKFVFANRDFSRRHQELNSSRFDRYRGQPGIYMLHDAQKRKLFVDRALDLGTRLSQHANCDALARQVEYVSLVPQDELPGAEYQNGFKVDLVRRHLPEFNVNLVGLSGSIAS